MRSKSWPKLIIHQTLVVDNVRISSIFYHTDSPKTLKITKIIATKQKSIILVNYLAKPITSSCMHN
jgi:hypothetical protein